jgi:hypothetical protein
VGSQDRIPIASTLVKAQEFGSVGGTEGGRRGSSMFAQMRFAFSQRNIKE